jgi:hypothetical protein
MMPERCLDQQHRGTVSLAGGQDIALPDISGLEKRSEEQRT